MNQQLPIRIPNDFLICQGLTSEFLLTVMKSQAKLRKMIWARRYWGGEAALRDSAMRSKNFPEPLGLKERLMREAGKVYWAGKCSMPWNGIHFADNFLAAAR